MTMVVGIRVKINGKWRTVKGRQGVAVLREDQERGLERPFSKVEAEEVQSKVAKP